MCYEIGGFGAYHQQFQREMKVRRRLRDLEPGKSWNVHRSPASQWPMHPWRDKARATFSNFRDNQNYSRDSRV